MQAGRGAARVMSSIALYNTIYDRQKRCLTAFQIILYVTETDVLKVGKGDRGERGEKVHCCFIPERTY